MIICDVCETLIVVTGAHDGPILCPYCNFDNTYQVEEEAGFFDRIILTLDEYDSLDDETLIQIATERFGLPEDQIIEIIHDQELIGRNLNIEKRCIK